MEPLAIGMLLLIVIGQTECARLLDGKQSGEIQAVQMPPKWPDAYEMEYTLSLPYVQTMQPEGLRYPVHVWWDGPSQRYRIDIYGGMDSMGWDLKQGYNWNLYPRIDELTCDFTNGTSGPTSASNRESHQLMALLGLGEGEAATPLPDISTWSYAGTAQVRDVEATVWQFSVRNGEKTANYQFFTAQNGWPLRFYMMGRNLITGSHFDEYVIEFTRFKPGTVTPAAFALPEICTDGTHRRGQPAASVSANMGDAARLAFLLPAARLGAGAGSAVLNELRGRAESAMEANARLVEEHNRLVRRAAAAVIAAENGASAAMSSASLSSPVSAPSYLLSLNHFAHMTHQQWIASMLGLGRKAPASKYTAAAEGSGRRSSSAVRGVYQRVLSDEKLPTFVDWRGSGADGPGVKDQVSCGSCWAFSAAGAMQGAWFKATGQSLSLSEQQLVDCAWDYGNDGCAGGYVEPTLQYVVDAGGIAQAADYPYLAQNSFCKGPTAAPKEPTADFVTGTVTSNGTATVLRSAGGATALSQSAVPLSARFSGFLNVASRDEGALMEAVALHGPVAVLMNAALAPFRFYSEGVYYNEQCGQDPDSMDHAILLVGYGTTAEGVDYWLIKNSWSKYWGMDGYARIARKGNDCGITTDAVLALVDPMVQEMAATVTTVNEDKHAEA